MRNLFNVTFDYITPESLECGDIADSGFVGETGYRYALGGLCGEPAADLKRQTAMTLAQAVAVFGRGYGACGLENDGGTAFYQSDFTTSDFRTGAQERLAFHAPRNTTPASRARLARILKN